MTVTINAVTSTGLVQTSDGSGVIKLQSNGVTTNALAWVNYNASTQTIRSSYNVSSITYISTGQYRINFTNALADANYSVCGSTGLGSGGGSSTYWMTADFSNPRTTSSLWLIYLTSNGASFYDQPFVNIIIFGN